MVNFNDIRDCFLAEIEVLVFIKLAKFHFKMHFPDLSYLNLGDIRLMFKLMAVALI